MCSDASDPTKFRPLSMLTQTLAIAPWLHACLHIPLRIRVTGQPRLRRQVYDH